MFAGSAVAGSCPVQMKKIDQALESGQHESLSAEQMEQVRELRAEGERLHQSGKHGESVETLMKAEKMLGIAQ